MTGLSRCGRVYRTFDEAYKAAESRSAKGAARKVVSCALADHWHVVLAAEFVGRPKRYRPDPFPPLVASLIHSRDGEACQRCGVAGRLHVHHRRAKGSGGSKARSHTQCPCNGILLCWQCHRWAHEHPAKARDLGIVVLQSADRPGRAGVTRFAEAPSDLFAADEQWLTCAGQWVHGPAETED